MAKTVTRMICSLEPKKKKKKSKVDKLQNLSDDEIFATAINIFDSNKQEVS